MQILSVSVVDTGTRLGRLVKIHTLLVREGAEVRRLEISDLAITYHSGGGVTIMGSGKYSVLDPVVVDAWNEAMPRKRLEGWLR